MTILATDTFKLCHPEKYGYENASKGNEVF